MRRTIMKSLVPLALISSGVMLVGCSGESRYDWDLDTITPTATAEALIVPEGVLPYTLISDFDTTGASQVTFNYPESWQPSYSKGDFGVESDAQLLVSFISANGEGVIVERFITEDQKDAQARTVSQNSNQTVSYLPITPGSRISAMNNSLDESETVTHENIDDDVTHTSRILEGESDGYSYSITLLQRSPSELTNEQAQYILDSFELT